MLRVMTSFTWDELPLIDQLALSHIRDETLILLFDPGNTMDLYLGFQKACPTQPGPCRAQHPFCRDCTVWADRASGKETDSSGTYRLDNFSSEIQSRVRILAKKYLASLNIMDLLRPQCLPKR